MAEYWNELTCAGCDKPIEPGQARILQWAAFESQVPERPDRAWHNLECLRADLQRKRQERSGE